MDEELVGDWALVSWEAQTMDGRCIGLPFDTHPIGHLTLSPDGYLQVQMMRRSRTPLPVTRQSAVAPNLNDPVATAAAFDSFMAYAGPCETDPEARELRTRVEVCLLPEWEGTLQVRKYEVTSDELRLESLPRVVDEVAQIGVLTWHRRGGGRSA